MKIAAETGKDGITTDRRHTDTDEITLQVQISAMVLKRDGAQYVRPDICLCGGITGGKKIAALAEANGVMVVPHNPLSPVSTAA